MLKGTTQQIFDNFITIVAMVFFVSGLLAIARKSMRAFVTIVPEVNPPVEVSGNSTAINVKPYSQTLSIRTPRLNTVDEEVA